MKIKRFKLFTENIESNKEILSDFIDFLPIDLPSEIDALVKKSNLGIDGAFYILLGAYIEKYGEMQDMLSDIIIEEEDLLFDLIDAKYGEGVIEW